MIAHLNVPALDSSENSISSLSEKIVTDLLQNKLGYEGLKISDALDMMSVSKSFKKGLAELKALEAGIDILLYPHSMAEAIKKIKNAIAAIKAAMYNITIMQ